MERHSDPLLLLTRADRLRPSFLWGKRGLWGDGVPSLGAKSCELGPGPHLPVLGEALWIGLSHDGALVIV